MKTAERTRIAFERGTPDRVPVHCWLGLPMIKKLKPAEKRCTDMLRVVDRRPDGLDREDAAGPRSRPDDHDLQPAHRRARDLAADALPATVRDGYVGRDVRGDGRGDGWREHVARDPHARRRPRLLLPHRGRLRHVVPRLPAQGRRAGEEAARAAPLPVRRSLRHDDPEGHGRESGRRGLVAAPRHRSVGHGRGGPRARRPLHGHLRPPRVRPRPHARLHGLADGLLPAGSARPASIRSR